MEQSDMFSSPQNTDAFSPQQSAPIDYSPQQPAGFPEPGYPSEQPGAFYPPHQPVGYPPPLQQGYPNQDPFKPGLNDAPPSYFGHDTKAPPPVFSQTGTAANVVMVNSQPQVTRVAENRDPIFSIITLVVSIVLTVVCIFCGGYCSLFCTVPAIILSATAIDAERRGEASAKTRNGLSLCCSIMAFAVWIIVWVVIIAISVATAGSSSSTCTYSYNSYYNTYGYYC